MDVKYILVFSLICFILNINNIQADKPCDDPEIKCDQTNYESFKNCMEKQRVKRQLCPNAAVNSCYGTSCNTAQTGVNCVRSNCVVPSSKIIINTCQDSCEAACYGVSCKERCGISCQNPQPPIVLQPVQPRIELIPEIQPTPKTTQSPIVLIAETTKTQPPISPNVTTVIKLTNIVNNTNVINIPTTINNTNINHLKLDTNATSSSNHERENCCLVTQPKVCDYVKNKENKTIYRCTHRRHHTCGDICKSQIVHAQVRQPCNGPPSTCPPSIAYIPQPTPRCIYQPIWPYVNCGYRSTPQCAGCYDHYGYGFHNYHRNSAPDCTGCYDDGFQIGYLYRQGPFYRPCYYHTPPCYMTGTCGPIQQPGVDQMMCTSSGCFGHELIDPAFGIQSYSPYSSSIYPHPYYGLFQPIVVVINGNSSIDGNPYDENAIIPPFYYLNYPNPTTDLTPIIEEVNFNSSIV